MNHKILIVDDSSIVLHFHGAILQEAGYSVDTAINGYLALEKLNLSRYNVIVTDINMDNMDGYSLITKIRQMDEYQETPIIIVSTENDEKEKKQGYAVGADLFLNKPINPQEFIEKLKMLLM